jgi:hypothetical protein
MRERESSAIKPAESTQKSGKTSQEQKMEWRIVLKEARKARATDAKEVGVKDPAEETFCHPNRNVIKNDIIDFQKVNRTPP